MGETGYFRGLRGRVSTWREPRRAESRGLAGGDYFGSVLAELPRNVDRATLSGVTLGVDAAWRDTRVKGSLDLQEPEDDATGALLPRRARRHGVLTVLQQAGPVQVGAEFVASSLRYDDLANTRKMGGYGIVNVTLDWPFASGWVLSVRGNNVLDKDYQLAADYATGGANVFATIRWQP